MGHTKTCLSGEWEIQGTIHNLSPMAWKNGESGSHGVEARRGWKICSSGGGLVVVKALAAEDWRQKGRGQKGREKGCKEGQEEKWWEGSHRDGGWGECVNHAKADARKVSCVASFFQKSGKVFSLMFYTLTNHFFCQNFVSRTRLKRASMLHFDSIGSPSSFTIVIRRYA